MQRLASISAAKFLMATTWGDDPNHLPVINPETAPIVKRIFDMRVQGMSPLKICSVLNEEHIPSPAEYYYQQRGESDPQN